VDPGLRAACCRLTQAARCRRSSSGPQPIHPPPASKTWRVVNLFSAPTPVGSNPAPIASPSPTHRWQDAITPCHPQLIVPTSRRLESHEPVAERGTSDATGSNAPLTWHPEGMKDHPRLFQPLSRSIRFHVPIRCCRCTRPRFVLTSSFKEASRTFPKPICWPRFAIHHSSFVIRHSLPHRRAAKISSFIFALISSIAGSGKTVSSVPTPFVLLLVLLIALARSALLTSPCEP